MLNLTRDVRQRIKNELHENEVIVWIEKPSYNKYVKLEIKIFSYISLLIFIITFTIIFDSFFFAILLSMITCFCIFVYLECKKVIYMITNHRAIVLHTKTFKDMTSHYPDQLTTIKIKEKFGTRGDIIFFTENYKAKNNFINIKDVGRIEALLERLANGGGNIDRH